MEYELSHKRYTLLLVGTNFSKLEKVAKIWTCKQ